MKEKQLKIAYIGGGSRAWAWVLMNDLAAEPDIAGDIYLYDIDAAAAQANAIIGNRLTAQTDNPGKWNYKVAADIDAALGGADFVIISIMPGDFDDMQNDVHIPDEYGIYQTVGDSSGPGGYVRAMRCVPLYRHFADRIRENCPNAWVLNYTNPMTLCVAVLFEEFPQIKAFGCCHEVFGTQSMLLEALKRVEGIEATSREEIITDVIGINHFTWLTSATYKDRDLFAVFKEYAAIRRKELAEFADEQKTWLKNPFASADMLKFELFDMYGVIAAAGDRHLAEFLPSKWFLQSEESIRDKWCFNRTSVSWRKNDLKERKQKSLNYKNGTEEFVPTHSKEEGVRQIKALLGMERFVTNINLPNRGQAAAFAPGAVVETNAVFSGENIEPVISKPLPDAVNALISRHVFNQQAFIKAAFARDVKAVCSVLKNDPLCDALTFCQVEQMFDRMVKATEKHLKGYWF